MSRPRAMPVPRIVRERCVRPVLPSGESDLNRVSWRPISILELLSDKSDSSKIPTNGLDCSDVRFSERRSYGT